MINLIYYIYKRAQTAMRPFIYCESCELYINKPYKSLFDVWF